MEILQVLQIVSLVLIVFAHLAMRSGSGDHRERVPFGRAYWRLQPWFTPTGYWVQVVGWTGFLVVFGWRVIRIINSL